MLVLSNTQSILNDTFNTMKSFSEACLYKMPQNPAIRNLT